MTVHQVDTYFRVPSGLLKRREVRGEPPEWVRYDREERAEPGVTSYRILDDAEARSLYGSRPLPAWLRVEKTRRIYMLDTAHVMVDEVARLGWFLKLSAIVNRRQRVEVCTGVVERVRAALAPALGGAIATSYADMMALELNLDSEATPRQA
jgi:adenylate cyclase class IV